MSKQLDERVVERYINEYYKKAYRICERSQPNFWEAVKILSLDIDSDVSKLIKNEDGADICYGTSYGSFVHISNAFLENVDKTFGVLNAAKIIASEIIQNENSDADVNVELFLFKKKMEKFQEEINWLKPNIECL